MSGSPFDVGRTVQLHIEDGHVLSGKIIYSGPDRLMLVYPGGMHVVYRRAIITGGPGPGAYTTGDRDH